MDQATLRSFEAKCVQEEPPACQTGCPLHVDARSFIALMAKGKAAEARKVLDRSMPLSGLLGCLCEGPCRVVCRRAEIDEGINMPMLERACLAATNSTKPFPLPGTGKRIAVAGGGLSSLVLAYELAKKGHSLSLYHAPGALGGTLRQSGDELLPDTALENALSMLAAMRVEFVEFTAQTFDAAWIEAVLQENLALYIGLDDPALKAENFGLNTGNTPAYVNVATLETANPKVFAGGAHCAVSGRIGEAFDGKKAALSIERFMQGVAPSSMRDKEGPYPTRLYTNISGIAEQKAVVGANPAAPTMDEAMAEAGRCIQCQCLECVKNCAFLRLYKSYPKKLAREMYNNLAVVQGMRQANTMISSCAECGLCGKICPHDADMGVFCGIAREEMVRAKHMPASFHEFALDDMHYSNDADIFFIRHQPGASASQYVFFPGCQLPASLPAETEALYQHLSEHLTGGVGMWFACCGAPAKWAGRAQLADNTAARMRQSWEEHGKPTIITACASCSAFFREKLGDVPMQSLWEVLNNLPLPPNAKAAPLELALHDPCASRENNAMQSAIRGLLEKLGQPTEELALSGSLTRCCGYGGLSDQVNPQAGNGLACERAADTQNILLCYCIMCRDRIRAVGKPALHALNLLFPQVGAFVAASAEESAARPAPGISNRQYTRLIFRQRLLKKLWNELPVRNVDMDKIKIVIADEAAPLLEKRRILHTDIQKVLLHQPGGQFFNEATGRALSCFKPKNVTFWVEHSLNADGSYTIHNAYCHRMTVPGVPAAQLENCDSCCGCTNTGHNAEQDI